MTKNNCEDLVKLLQEKLPHQNNEYLRSPRYFRSCLHDHQYDVDKTEAAILKTYKWREEIGIDSILKENFDDIFVPFIYEFDGHDKAGRPILTVHSQDLSKKANAKMHKAVKDGLKDKERSIRWGFFMGESLLDAIANANSKSKEHNVDSFVIIIDMKGIKITEFIQYAPQVLPTAQPLFTTCREHYSGMVHKTYILNGSKAPAKLGLQLMKQAQTQEAFVNIEDRVKLLGKKKHKWQKILLEDIDADQLSVRFGGTREPKEEKLDPITLKTNRIMVEQVMD